MFISSSFLSISYGVDDKIARFFVDREPPADNLYWKDKLLYLRPAPGYLFIPLIVDLLFKLGLERQQLLSEKFVGVMEQIGHISALEETGRVNEKEAIESCLKVVKDICKNREWYNSLSDFFNNGTGNFFRGLSTPFKALHRGDLFLASICSLRFPGELSEKIAEFWFALISTLLLLDDAEDIETDKKTGDLNAFLESGLDPRGVETILQLVSKNLRKISTLNGNMAHQLDQQFKDLITQPHISKYLNHS